MSLDRSGNTYSWVPADARFYPVPAAAVFDIRDVIEAATKAQAVAIRYAIPPDGERWIDESGNSWGTLEDSFDLLVQYFAENLRKAAIRDGFLVEDQKGCAA